MSPHGIQEDRLPAFVLDELENDSQIERGAAGPVQRPFAFEFVGSQRGCKRVLSQRRQRLMNRLRRLRSLLDDPFRRAHESLRLQKRSVHVRMSRKMSSGVAGTALPSSN